MRPHSIPSHGVAVLGLATRQVNESSESHVFIVARDVEARARRYTSLGEGDMI